MTQTSLKSTNRLGDRRGLHPNSLANLVPEPTPETRNRKGYSLKSKLQDALLKKNLAELKPECVGDQIVLATIKGAIDLVPVAHKEVWDRVEGSVNQQQPSGPNLQINIVVSPTGQELLMRLRAQGGKPALREG